MTRMRWFPSIGFVVEIQDYLVKRFGGTTGIRDEHALSLALQPSDTNCPKGIAVEAAALMENLYSYRPFLDGNKRVATTVGEVFLQQNGYYIAVEDDFDAYDFFMELFDEDVFQFANLIPWLEQHIRPLP